MTDIDIVERLRNGSDDVQRTTFARYYIAEGSNLTFKEIADWFDEAATLISQLRNRLSDLEGCATIEECAKLADSFQFSRCTGEMTAAAIASAIRKLNKTDAQS